VVRAQLAEVTALVQTIRGRLTKAGDEKSPRERMEQALRLALRAVATLRASFAAAPLVRRRRLPQGHVHGEDGVQPLRHHVWELPVIKPKMTEHQTARLVACCFLISPHRINTMAGIIQAHHFQQLQRVGGRG
jgi:hypothetical protein